MGGCGDARPYPPPRQAPLSVALEDTDPSLAFDLPAYRGQLRVMAVTASAKKLGRAEAKVTVRDPLVLHWPNGIAAKGEVRYSKVI